MRLNTTVISLPQTYRKMFLSTKLSFGKYRETTIYTIIKNDVTYAKWLLKIWNGEVDDKVSKYIKYILEISK